MRLPSLLLVFCNLAEPLEPIAPQLRQERVKLGYPLRPELVQAPGAFPVDPNQPHSLEDLQMLRDGGTCHTEVRGDLTGGELAVSNELQDSSTAGIRDGLKGRVHGR